MNRLVIIGNGFDLAHGLPTSYRDFIDDFWKDLENKYKSDYIRQILYLDENYYVIFKYGEINNYEDFKNNVKQYANNYSNEVRIFDDKNKFELYKGQSNFHPILRFNNDFFEIINVKNVENWVDIENEYYRQLKKIINSKCLDVSKSEEFWENEQRIKVQKLNTEFEEIKRIFEQYLCEKVIKKYEIDFSILKNKDWIDFYNYLKPISVFNNEQNVLKEFLIKEDNSDIKNLFLREKREEVVNKIYFLNFNYTPILNTYCKKLNEDDRIECDINFIHGELENNNENKINFGFGDEMDDDYKAIENINDNEYLKYFKSFQYLQNSNYSNLLSYMDSDKFQVVVMGHSCGLSDRTLLNTIFEHNNCRSIKVCYYQWIDEKTRETKDNYTEIIQNISRHFNKKKLMREKIVNKTLCKPLPQIQLPKK